MGRAWDADLVAICGTPALLACVGEGLGCRFCRYLRYSRSLGVSWAGLGKQILSLFAVLPLVGASGMIVGVVPKTFR